MMALQFRVQLIQLRAGVMDRLAGSTKNTHVLTRRREECELSVISCSGVTVGEGLCFSRRLRRLLKLKVRAVICLLGDFGFQSFWFVNILCLRGRTGQMVYQRKVDEFDLVAS